MKKKNGLIVAVVWVCLLFLAVQPALAQNFTFKLIGTDQVQVDTLTLGLNSTATYDADPSLGEAEWAPIGPPGPFDLRSADLPSHPTRGTGAGQHVDIRNSSNNPTQIDTFIISFRSSDDVSSQAVTFSWPSGLTSVGYGGFTLTDGGLNIFPNIDMAFQTSFTYPVKSTSLSQTIYIIVGNAYRFRTFPYDSIANAHDSKGKQKAEKRKNYASEWTLTFTNDAPAQTTSFTADGMNIKFSQNVTQWLSSVNISPAVPLPSKGPFHFVTTVPHGSSFVVSGTGDKGKAMVAKGALWTNAANTATKGVKFNGTGPSRLLLRMPNINNVGEEIYAQPGNVDPVNGIVAGVFSTGHAVIHPKWKDVMKTVIKGKVPITYHDQAARCLTTYGTGKPWTKVIKSAPPDKYINKLDAEQVAFKLNIDVSNSGKSPTGFGDLIYTNGSSPFDGQSVDTIAAKVDRYLAYCDSSSKGGFTGQDLYDLMYQIIGAFDGTFDTLTFGNPAGSKTQGTSFAGTQSALVVGFLSVPPGGVTHPVNRTPYSIPETPDRFILNQNYPNPFNPTTKINFSLPEDAFVTVKVYNMLGQEVVTLVNHEEYTEGENEIEFNAQNLGSGVYFYRVVVNDGQFQQVKKMMLLK